MKIVHCVNSTFVSRIWIEGKRGEFIWEDNAFPHQFFEADEFMRTIQLEDRPVVQDTEDNKELNQLLRQLGKDIRTRLGGEQYLIDYCHSWYDAKGNTRTSPAEARRQWWGAFWLGVLTGVITGFLVGLLLIPLAQRLIGVF